MLSCDVDKLNYHQWLVIICKLITNVQICPQNCQQVLSYDVHKHATKAVLLRSQAYPQCRPVIFTNLPLMLSYDFHKPTPKAVL